MQYDPSLSDLMDFFCEGEHHGFPEGGIQGAETRLGMALPPVYRAFLKTYGMDDINFHFNQLEYPGTICTTYEILEKEFGEDIKTWDCFPELEKAVKEGREAEYADNPLFRLWRLPKERWGEVTDNYLIIWYENQGVWSAGYRVRDLLDENPDPPVYISTDDDYVTYQKWMDNTEDFLREMLRQAAYGWHDGQRFTKEDEIQTALSVAGIDPARFRIPYRVSFALSEDGETLYAYWQGAEFQELLTANRHKAVRKLTSTERRTLTVPVLQKDKYKPDSKGPFRPALESWQKRDLGMDRPKPENGLPLHPLVSLVMFQASGRLPSTAYDWQKAAAKIKHLKLELNNRSALRYDGDLVYIRPLDEHFPPAPCYYDLSDWSMIGKMENLQSLYIDSILVDDPNLWPLLTKLPKLQNLRIQNTQVGDFSFLPHCKELKSVSFYNTDFSDCRLLLELPKLQEADIRFCPLIHWGVLNSASIKIHGPRSE